MEIKFTTRRVVHISSVAALYVVFTVALAPLSYGPIQFRVSEALKVFVLLDPWMAVGIGIGTFFANMTSPFVGPWELIWMPLSDMAGGLLAWLLYRLLKCQRAIVPMVLYAVTTGLAVAFMLWILGLGSFWFLAFSVSLSETIIFIASLPMMMKIGQWLENQR